MAGSSVQIIRDGSSTEYLDNSFRDGIILVVINLEPKQVDTKKSLAMKEYVPFITVTKVKMKIISYWIVRPIPKIRVVFFLQHGPRTPCVSVYFVKTTPLKSYSIYFCVFL